MVGTGHLRVFRSNQVFEEALCASQHWCSSALDTALVSICPYKLGLLPVDFSGGFCAVLGALQEVVCWYVCLSRRCKRA
jgi:hypothetical protein